MREILFRGKRLDNGEWIYGYYAKLPHPITAFLKDFIVEVKFDETDVVGETDYVLVNPKTVGQFTGLLDKNGNKIFEGDIVKMDGLYYLIKWDDEGGKWCMSLERYWMDYLFLTKKKAPFMEIIGNIHENGELLK